IFQSINIAGTNCQPCRQGWIHFQGKCYLFYKKSYPWMTWQQSQNYCKDEDADLVVVDSLQEQVNRLDHHDATFHL
uniref:C-type lectin domain-containing protein n=1 Tax=Echeneis naucrates TaxID=173247 RepID=A0A665UB59_ECHNA